MRTLTRKFSRWTRPLIPPPLLSPAEIHQKAIAIVRAELQNPPFIPPWPWPEIFIDLALITCRESDVQAAVTRAEKKIAGTSFPLLLLSLAELTKDDKYLGEAMKLISDNPRVLEESGHRGMTENLIRILCQFERTEEARELVPKLRSPSCCRCCETDMLLVIAGFTLREEDLQLVLATPEKERWGMGPVSTNADIALLLVKFGRIEEAREIALRMAKECPSWDSAAKILVAIASATGQADDIQSAWSTISQIDNPLSRIMAEVGLAVISGDTVKLNNAWQKAQEVEEAGWRSNLILEIAKATN